jgi:transposase
MVEAVREGQSLRSVARVFGVSLRTVQYWVGRAQGKAFESVDWSSHKPGPKHPPSRCSQESEDKVVEARRYLKEEDALGYYGAAAIREHLLELGLGERPSERTINRILERRGLLDATHRVRFPAPARGWYLPDVREGLSELDLWDRVEGLVIKDGPQVEVLNVISLHGRLAGSWPKENFSAALVRGCLLERWQRWGLPTYAQFDNDTLFQGPHQHPDTIGSVSRLCLQLAIVPVFVPPREFGFQAAIENYNGDWETHVWQRFQHRSLAGLLEQSDLYTGRHQARTAWRREGAPERRPFPENWQLDLQQHPSGQMIFLRRSNDHGEVSLLGHAFPVDAHWTQRLVRCQVHLDEGVIRLYALRRRAPQTQPLLAELPYQLPRRRFHE